MNKNKKEKPNETEAETVPKTLVILSKPSSEKNNGSSLKDSLKGDGPKSESPPMDIKPSPGFVIKPRETSSFSREESPAKMIKDFDSLSLSSSSSSAHSKLLNEEGQNESKLSFSQEMTEPLKLLDDSLQWSDESLEFFQDHSDYYVVGVIGMQGVGKSTILSILNDNDFFEKPLFLEQNLHRLESGLHCTEGIDVFISSDRLILLDMQPILSISFSDMQLKSASKNLKMEYLSLENSLYIQSLQLAAFMMNVCHTVLVVNDWFIDVSLLKFLLTAEMLRPTLSSSTNHETASEVFNEYHPNIVFVQNKCQKADFSGKAYKKMRRTLSTVFNKSKLKVSGNITMDFIVPKPNSEEDNINLFLMPDIDTEDSETESRSTDISNNLCYPGLEYMAKSFAQQICSMPHTPIYPTATTIKSWYHFACKSWDAIKKSNFYSEYSRLMPQKMTSGTS